MGVEKKRRELLGKEDSSCSLRFQQSGIDDPGNFASLFCGFVQNSCFII